MFKTLCRFLRKRQTASHLLNTQVLVRPPWQAEQIERNIEWMRDFWGFQQSWKPTHYNPQALEAPQHDEMDPHWLILKHLCRWNSEQYKAAPQEEIDRSIAEILGISRTHAALMRLGYHHRPVIWPDMLVERDGIYPWATPEIHAFWAHLDRLTQAQFAQVISEATRQDDALKSYWRELHGAVLTYFPTYQDVIRRAVMAVPHSCSQEWQLKLAQIKVKATFEVLAVRLPYTAVPCRYLALFGYSSAADLLASAQTVALTETRP